MGWILAQVLRLAAASAMERYFDVDGFVTGRTARAAGALCQTAADLEAP